MKIALIRPMPSDESVGLHSFMICEPLELEYLYASLSQASHEPIVIDMMCEARPLIDILDEVRPDVVAFTSYITHVNVIKRYAAEVKQSAQSLGNVTTIVGGLHAEVNPQDFVDANIDYIACQNGLETLTETINLIASNVNNANHANNASNPDVIETVLGLWNGSEKRAQSIYPPHLPLPDRASTARYRSHYNYLFHDNVSLLKTSYGCPYSCEFCYCRAITDGKYSQRPMADVINELAQIRESNVFIVDDDFLLKRDRVSEFCDALETRGINKRFILFGRTDFITKYPDLIARFANLGLHAVFIGAESFRQEDLENYSKKNSVAITEQASKILHDNIVEPYVGIVIGPDWSPEDFRGLSRWIRKHGLELANIQPLTPMPGTDCYSHYENRLTVQRENHELFDMTHLILQPSKMSIRRFYWELIRTYYETTASPKTVLYIYRRYGFRVALRMMRGGLRITKQYIALMAKG